MKRNLFLLLILVAASIGFTSCDKEKPEQPKPTTVNIEGKDYPIVTIGNQTWMAANYSGSGGVYYDNNANNSESGKFYTKEEAKALVPPAGWRLPSHQDYISLFQSQGITFTVNGDAGYSYMSEALRPFMSIGGWLGGQGTNTNGFNGHPVGFYDEGKFAGKGASFSFWTSTEQLDQRYYFGIFNTAAQPYAFYGPLGGETKFCVRFVKNN